MRYPDRAQGAAVFDPTGRYRYRLERYWGSGPCVAFVMLNPNTADATHDDPTIRRCVGFARRWGFGRLVVVNLFAYRARHPRALRTVRDPVGPDADRHLVAAAAEAHRVVAAWGNHGQWRGRDEAALALLGAPLCLGLTNSGAPRHPLYLPADTSPVPLHRSSACAAVNRGV